MVKRSYRDLFVISISALGYIWNYFKKLGVLLKIDGSRLDFGQVQGVLCNVLGIFPAGDFF
jgi:hypothetical protein